MLKRKKNQRSATDSDRTIGKQVRSRRMMAGLSQAALAETLGVSFQQVQKYEKGTNRLGAGRLMQVAKTLKCEIADLMPSTTVLKADPQSQALLDLMATREGVELARAFKVLPSGLRRSVITIVEQMGAR